MPYRPNLSTGLAADLAQAIRAGILVPGERLPSLRALSEARRVSISTVQLAFAQLEARGLIVSREREGTFVAPRPVGPERPARLPPFEGQAGTSRWYKGAELALRPEAVNFVRGDLWDPHVPFEALNRLALRIGKAQPRTWSGLPLGAGHVPLRRRLAQEAAGEGWEQDPEEIVLVSSLTEALRLALSAVAPAGSAVACESPTSARLIWLLESLGLRAVGVPRDPEKGVDLAALERAAAAEPLAAIVVSPHHGPPYGTRLPESQLRGLLRLAERHDVPVIEHDAFRELGFGPRPPLPLKALDRGGRVLYCAGPEKILGVGLRVAWCAPGRYRQRFLELMWGQDVVVPPLCAEMLTAFLEEGYRRHVRRLRETMRREAAALREAAAAAFPEGTAIVPPEGGFYLALRLPEGAPPVPALLARAEAAGVQFAPGALFAVGEPPPAERGLLALSFALPFSPARAEGLRRLGALAGEAPPAG